MLLDTGSAVSAGSNNVYLSNFSHFRLEPETVVLQGYDGSAFVPNGSFKANVKYEDILRSVKFNVVNGDGPNILGRDWLDGFKIKISIRWS